ncbi:MAG TPA: peptidylprolyl isomerase, partial [Roseovarius nubinhibens]|nr:peptidylprolyl isomerase [Roseovarius nubinhibens]
GRSEQALARAARVEADTDTCDDLYGIAQGEDPRVLERGSKAPSEIPQDIAYELSKLDPGEVSYTLTRSNGETLVLLMLCGRSQTIAEEAPATGETTADSAEGEAAANALSETEMLSRQIGDQRLASYADGYMAQLKAEARIVEK